MPALVGTPNATVGTSAPFSARIGGAFGGDHAANVALAEGALGAGFGPQRVGVGNPIDDGYCDVWDRPHGGADP